MKRDEDDEIEEVEKPEEEKGGWIYHVPILARKYGSHLMLVASLVILGWVLWKRHEQNKLLEQDKDWATLSDAESKVNMAAQGLSDENPANALRTVASASEQPGVRATAYLALGQYYLNAVNIGHYGQVEQVDVPEALRDAETAFNKVISDLPEETPFVLKAKIGLGRVAEDRADWETAKKDSEAAKADWKTAKKIYADVAAEAQKAGFLAIGKSAEMRLADLPAFGEQIAFAPAPVPSSQPSAVPGLPDGGFGPMPR